MRSGEIVLALALAGCADGGAEPTATAGSLAPSSMPVASSSTTPGTATTTVPSTTAGTMTTMVPSATVAPTTVPSVTVAPSIATVAPSTAPPNTQPATTKPPPDPLVADGLAVARRLATAFADGNWTAARLISPTPPFSDDMYEQGFEGLESETVYLADARVGGRGVELWLALVALESRLAGRQTSLYCAHWRYMSGTGAIVRVAETSVRTERGVVDPASFRSEGRVACARFDTE